MKGIYLYFSCSRNSWQSLECTKETFRAIYPPLLSQLISQGNLCHTHPQFQENFTKSTNEDVFVATTLGI